LSALSRIFQQFEAGQLAEESLVVACTTAVEAHFDRVLNELINRSQATSNLLFDALLTATRDDIFRSWDARLNWLNKGFGIAIATDAPTQRYRLVLDLRNSLVHGNGQLTDFQIRNFNRAHELRRQMNLHLGVQFNGRRLLLMGDTGAKAVEFSREMVVHLDESW
jgi:hypothetical protein